jgi:hypothetical protein
MILLSPREDIDDPPGRIEKMLDSDTGQAYLPIVSRAFVPDKSLNPNEEHMGSTTFGNVNPATMIGPAMPQDIRINRAGLRRVRGMVAPG